MIREPLCWHAERGVAKIIALPKNSQYVTVLFDGNTKPCRIKKANLQSVPQSVLEQKANSLAYKINKIKQEAIPIATSEKWKNILTDQEINGFEFNLVLHYELLTLYADQLRLCSAGRPDLQEEFFNGTLLRYSVHHKGQLQALIAIRPDSNENHKPFKFYGLSYNHVSLTPPTEKGQSISLSSWDTPRNESVSIKRTNFNNLCLAFNEFKEKIFNNDTSFDGIAVKEDTHYG